MLIEAKPPQHRSLLTLLPVETSNLEPRAVLMGNNPGRAFVDCTEEPSRLLVWSQGIEGFYLAGEPSLGASAWRDVQHACRQTLADAGNPLATGCEISGVGGGAWDGAFRTTFAGRIGEWRQLVFRGPREMPASQPKPSTLIAPGYRLRLIDAGLLADRGACRGDLLSGAISQYWASPDDFLRAGLGWAVLSAEGEVVSICHSGFVAGRVHAINVETAPAHRRRRLAHAAALAFLDSCHERRLEPYWDCMEDNVPSASLAQAIGLELSFAYTCFAIPLD